MPRRPLVVTLLAMEPYRSIVIERLPFTEVDRSLRTAVKRVIGFQDASPDPSDGPRG